MSEAKAKQKVWRIYRYAERYELKDDDRRCRKSALQFTRDFVSVMAGNEAVGYHQQLSMLQNGDGEEYFVLFGLYRTLINEAGKRSRAYRGYLLDAANGPLSDAKLARMFKIHVKKMSKLLRRLEVVDLLERVDVPEWDLTLDELPPKKDDSVQEAGALETQKRGSRSKNKACAGDGRRRTAQAGDGQQPFKKTNNYNYNSNKNFNKQQARSGKTTASARKEKTTIDNGQKKTETQAQAEAQGKAQEQTVQAEPSPPTTQPSAVKPQESDAGGERVTPTPSPLPSLSQGGQSRHGLNYGKRVYLGLGYHHDVDSAEARREITSFASKHDQIVSALSKLSPPMIDALLQRGLAEAVKIGRRKGNRCKGAVWHTVMDKLVAAAQAEKCAPGGPF
jgi:hypothetical protein